jgi:hypothetical protein
MLAVPAVAQEEEGSVTLGYGGGWYFLGGATGGASLTGDTGGGYVGAEASVARLRRGWWYGLYSDAFYDFGQQNMTITAGPEFGFSVFGIDGGIGVRPGPDQPLEVGPQIRGLVTVGLFAIYARYGFWPDSTTHRHVRQLGLMLKLPLAAPWAFGPSAGWDMGNRSRSR